MKRKVLALWMLCMGLLALGLFKQPAAAGVLPEESRPGENQLLRMEELEPQALPSITTQPKDASGKIGETVSFTVKASGTGLSYQWQTSKDGGKSWGNYSRKQTIQVEVKASLNKRQYRCVVTDAYGKSVTSKAVKLTVMIDGGYGPFDECIPVGGKAIFMLWNESGVGLKYQWQTSKDGGKTWGNYSTKRILEVEVKTSLHGRLFRCILTDANGNTYCTPHAVLKVWTRITMEPENASGKVGKTARFTIEASGVNLKYQWETSKDGGKTWGNYSSKQNLSIPIKESLNNRYFRCRVSGDDGHEVLSQEARLTVRGLPFGITVQPADVRTGLYDPATVDPDSSGEPLEVYPTALFFVNATGDNLQYCWEASFDKKTWGDIPEDWFGHWWLEGVHDMRLKIGALPPSWEGHVRNDGATVWLRCKISCAGGTLYTRAAKLTLIPMDYPGY